jgi:hypothetical protein
MNARLKWITPKRRDTQDIALADDGETFWAELDVVLTVRGAAQLKRGEATPIERADLPAFVEGTLTRTGLLSATVRVTGYEPEDLFDALARLDLDAAQRLHAHAKAGGLE